MGKVLDRSRDYRHIAAPYLVLDWVDYNLKQGYKVRPLICWSKSVVNGVLASLGRTILIQFEN